MGLRVGFSALALSAMVAMGSAAVADLTQDFEYDMSDASAHVISYCTVYKGDTVTFKLPTTSGLWGPMATASAEENKVWCAGFAPAKDVTVDTDCTGGWKTIVEVFGSGASVDGTNDDPVVSTGAVYTFSTPPAEKTTGHVRYITPTSGAITANAFLQVTAMGTDQSSAFSTAYAAGTFVASSMLVAAIALF